MQRFKEFMTNHQEKMQLYTQAVTKVHGKNHPEIFQVREEYQKILQGIRDDREDFNQEFAVLREISNNYSIPQDVCETYEAVYNNLKEADQIYHQV